MTMRAEMFPRPVEVWNESHGQGVGAIVDGLPAGMPIEVSRIQAALDRRRPAQGPATSSRRETDQVEVLSGVYRGCSTAAPLALWIANRDARERDYRQLENIPRPLKNLPRPLENLPGTFTRGSVERLRHPSPK